MDIGSIATDVKIHTWPDGQLLHSYEFKVREGFMKSLSWSKDGSWLVLVPSKGPAEVISVRENLKHLHSIHEIQQPTCAAFQNSTKRNIALATTTGMVLVYDVKLKNVHERFPQATSTISKIEYCSKDTFLIAAGKSEVLLYNSITHNLSSSYKVPNSSTVSNICCHPLRRNLVAGGSQEGVVAVWDIHTSKVKFTNQAHFAPVTDLTFSPLRNDLLVTIGLDRKLKFFETSSTGCVMQKVMDRSSTAIDFCPDGVGLAVSLQDGTIQTYDTRQMNSPLHSFMAHSGQIKQLLFRKKTSEESCEVSADIVESNVDIRLPVEAGNSCDSPGFLFRGDLLPDTPKATTEASAEDGVDSFFEALGFQLNSTSPSTQDQLPGIADGAEKPILSENNGQVHSSGTGEQVNDEKTFWKDAAPVTKIVMDEVKTKTSTPKIYHAEPLTNLSSISPDSQSSSVKELNEIDTKVIRSIVREELSIANSSLREEMKQEIDSLKRDIKYGQYNVMAESRWYFNGLQLYLVKQFIKTEESLHQLKAESAAQNCSTEDTLLQENMKLMQENVKLREVVDALRNQLLLNNNNNN